MTHRHTIARQLLLLLRDALGQFTRIRATLAEMARIMRPRPRARRPPALTTAMQLTLF